MISQITICQFHGDRRRLTEVCAEDYPNGWDILVRFTDGGCDIADTLTARPFGQMMQTLGLTLADAEPEHTFEPYFYTRAYRVTGEALARWNPVTARFDRTVPTAGCAVCGATGIPVIGHADVCGRVIA